MSCTSDAARLGRLSPRASSIFAQVRRQATRVILPLALIATVGVLPASAEAPLPIHPAAQRVLDLTNAERQQAGLAPLRFNSSLTTAAQGYAEVLAVTGCFAHDCGPVPDMVDRNVQAGYSDWQTIGENIAGGYDSPEAVVAGWMDSPPHRANILDPDFTEMGVGVVSGAGVYQHYWTLELGARLPLAAEEFAGFETATLPSPDEPPAEEWAEAAPAE